MSENKPSGVVALGKIDIKADSVWIGLVRVFSKDPIVINGDGSSTYRQLVDNWNASHTEKLSLANVLNWNRANSPNLVPVKDQVIWFSDPQAPASWTTPHQQDDYLQHVDRAVQTYPRAEEVRQRAFNQGAQDAAARHAVWAEQNKTNLQPNTNPRDGLRQYDEQIADGQDGVTQGDPDPAYMQRDAYLGCVYENTLKAAPGNQMAAEMRSASQAILDADAYARACVILRDIHTNPFSKISTNAPEAQWARAIAGQVELNAVWQAYDQDVGSAGVAGALWFWLADARNPANIIGSLLPGVHMNAASGPARGGHTVERFEPMLDGIYGRATIVDNATGERSYVRINRQTAEIVADVEPAASAGFHSEKPFRPQITDLMTTRPTPSPQSDNPRAPYYQEPAEPRIVTSANPSQPVRPLEGRSFTVQAGIMLPSGKVFWCDFTAKDFNELAALIAHDLGPNQTSVELRAKHGTQTVTLDAAGLNAADLAPAMQSLGFVDAIQTSKRDPQQKPSEQTSGFVDGHQPSRGGEHQKPNEEPDIQAPGWSRKNTDVDILTNCDLVTGEEGDLPFVKSLLPFNVVYDRTNDIYIVNAAQSGSAVLGRFLRIPESYVKKAYLSSADADVLGWDLTKKNNEILYIKSENLNEAINKNKNYIINNNTLTVETMINAENNDIENAVRVFYLQSSKEYIICTRTRYQGFRNIYASQGANGKQRCFPREINNDERIRLGIPMGNYIYAISENEIENVIFNDNIDVRPLNGDFVLSWMDDLSIIRGMLLNRTAVYDKENSRYVIQVTRGASTVVPRHLGIEPEKLKTGLMKYNDIKAIGWDKFYPKGSVSDKQVLYVDAADVEAVVSARKSLISNEQTKTLKNILKSPPGSTVSEVYFDANSQQYIVTGDEGNNMKFEKIKGSTKTYAGQKCFPRRIYDEERVALGVPNKPVVYVIKAAEVDQVLKDVGY
jgi:hypothetical protein